MSVQMSVISEIIDSKPHHKMWLVLTSAKTVMSSERISSLLRLHGLANEEYLCFCDDATLDELGSTLKPIPRRLYEYYRVKLWQPSKGCIDAIDNGDVPASVVAAPLYFDGSNPSQSIGSGALQAPASVQNNALCKQVEGVGVDSSTERPSTSNLSEISSHMSSTERVIETTSSADLTKCGERLSLFFADNRVASYECSEELALSYLEIFEDDVESAVAVFLASEPKVKFQQQSSLSEQRQKSTEMFVSYTHAGDTSCELNAVEEAAVTPVLRHGPPETLSTEAMELQAETKKLLGNTAMGAKEYVEAIRFYSEALDLSPEGLHSHVYYSNRAAAYCFLENYNLGAKDCESAIRLRADFAKAYSRLGLCHFHLGRFEKAVVAYERLVELEPEKEGNLEELRRAKKMLEAATKPAGFGGGTRSGVGLVAGSASATKNGEVFEKLQQFLECKKAIEQTWAGISSGQMEKIPALDTVQLPDMSWNFALRQQNLQGSPVQSLDELYEAAAAAYPILATLMRGIVAEAGLPAGSLHMAPLKGRVRAAEKAKDDYDERECGHGERWLFDIVRGAVLCDTEEQLIRMITALRGSSQIDLMRLKNRFAQPTPAGFRDFNLNIRVCISASVYHICELQVHCAAIKKMDEVKLSHKIYEYFRTYFRGEAKSIDERLRALEQVAGSVATVGDTLLSIVESALVLDDENNLVDVMKLLELLGEFEQNIRIQRKLVCIKEVRKGVNHPDTLASVQNLAALLIYVGEWADARELLDRAVQGFEKVLGPEHFNTLGAVANLASLLATLGERGEARGLYERALRGYEKVLGPEHPNTMQVITNHAGLLAGLAKFAEARALYERSLRGYENLFGPNHLDTVLVVNNLACLLTKIHGEESTALSLFERALRRFEQLLGPEHPSTLSALTNLANLLVSRGEMAKARALYEKSMRGSVKAFGPEHPDTLGTTCGLAGVLKDAGEIAEARALYERALRGQEKVLGPEHFQTLSTVYNLANLEKSVGATTKARALYERALRGQDVALGPEHPDTLRSANNFANLLVSLGELAKAQVLHERVLRGNEKLFGPDHPDTLQSMYNVANVLKWLGIRKPEARALYERALRGREKFLGHTHPHTRDTAKNLANLLDDLGERAEARALRQRWSL